MILTDGVHLISDSSEAELHEFAASIGLKRCWFRNKKRRRPHYDLTSVRKATVAFRAGAIRVSSREIVLVFRRRDRK